MSMDLSMKEVHSMTSTKIKEIKKMDEIFLVIHGAPDFTSNTCFIDINKAENHVNLILQEYRDSYQNQTLQTNDLAKYDIYLSIESLFINK